MVPLSGWLSAHLGRRNYFLLSIAIFTISSGLCGMATNLGQIILFRAIQGLAGGGLQPSSQGILLDAFPQEKQGAAMTVFGVAALIAPVVGPTLGGWITVQYEWRWIFYINVPMGILALVACYALVRDPDYLQQERAELKKRPFQFDSIGLSLLVLTMVCWEVMLSKGQEWDWLGHPQRDQATAGQAAQRDARAGDFATQQQPEDDGRHGHQRQSGGRFDAGGECKQVFHRDAAQRADRSYCA